ncbi:MAG: hypothetical protein JW915_01245 [Chitinispirillaceae bacterium]|nr:hypothetical protein [Chitinispirillaceae bacterium]
MIIDTDVDGPDSQGPDGRRTSRRVIAMDATMNLYATPKIANAIDDAFNPGFY